MARILISDDSKTTNLKLKLESLGHEVLFSRSNYNKILNSINELNPDLFLMDIKGKSFNPSQMEIISNIMNLKIPVIPIINLEEKSDYELLKNIATISNYGYLIKHSKKPYDIKELKFILELGLSSYLMKQETVFNLESETEEALMESEENFRSFIQQSLDGIVLLDEEGLVIAWNRGNELITGIKKEEALGREYLIIKEELTPPERRNPQHLERVKNLHNNALEKGAARFLGKKHETDILRPDGKLRYIEQVAFPIKTKKGYRIGYVTRDITTRKQMENALEKRIIALSRPLDYKKEINFNDLFNLKDIQKIQDLFSEATGVSSIITQPDGAPLTQPSNFTRLCGDIIRKTHVGLENCYKSDAIIGRHHPEGPIIMPCLSCGLWDAGASISVGGKHIANWLIGQVRNETQNEDEMRKYAREIGVDEEEYIKAFLEVPVMSESQLRKVAKVLFAFANQLSDVAYQNIQQASFITERVNAEKDLEKSLHETEIMNQVVMQLVEGTNSQQIYEIIGKAVHELLPDSYVLISREDAENGTIQIINCFGLNAYLSKLKNIIGTGINQINFKVNEKYDHKNLSNQSAELTELDNRTYDLVFSKIHEPIYKSIKKLLNIGKIYAIGFSLDDENFGALSIVLKNGKSLEHKKMIETIVSQASIALQRSQAELAIKESLKEKKVLLREIHHRVKNNMQIISSLLNLQSQHVDELETQDVLKESQGRVRSMAIIHENLYRSPSLTQIDFKDYIEKLTSNLLHTYQLQNFEIEMKFNVEDVQLNIDTAIPCGLIINELVTNSLKYAFPPSKLNSKGTIEIELKKLQGEFKLVVSDDGIGLPTDVNPEDSETLGLQLVTNLVRQMDGTMEIERTHGTQFNIVFKELKYKDRI